MAQFRAKARAVELLGKGQISDLPTAISELWKNGYDAYADNLEAFLFLPGYQNIKKHLFVISDDGKGMSRNDILEKWIVLGTDSKTRNTQEDVGPDTLWKPFRIKMGEKGIGRLSVAYLGSPMLMLSKKIGSPLQALFFDWRMLTNFNLFIEDVHVPIKTVNSVSDFKDVFLQLKKDFLENFPEYEEPEEDPWYEQLTIKNLIIEGCNSIEIPDFFETEILSPLLGDSNEVHGTKFIVFNPEEQLIALERFFDKRAEDEIEKGSIDNIVPSLTALFNIYEDEEHPSKAKFWIINNAGRYDLIEKTEFFTKDDFEICDHLIDGKFDAQGNFSGILRIFEKPVPYSFPLTGLKSNSSYGEFEIKIGYVQGDRGLQTLRLKGDSRDSFLRKLNKYGGMYIYRDGFRVLPYGRTDVDFLDFEKRRSERAGEYFFSYRRMFGYISITRFNNPELIDKAGREGFITNKAYRDFKRDLQAFFIDLAKSYFGDKAADPSKRSQQSVYEEGTEWEKREKEIEKREKKIFFQKLKELPIQLSQVQVELDKLNEELESKISQSILVYNDIQLLLKRIDQLKNQLNNYELESPSRYKPTELQEEKYLEYQQLLKEFKEKKLSKADQLVQNLLSKLKEKELEVAFQNRKHQYVELLEAIVFEHLDKIGIANQNLRRDFEDVKSSFVADFNNKISLIPAGIDIPGNIKLLDNAFIETRDLLLRKIKPITSHIERLTLDMNEDQLMGYYKIKYEEIKAEWDLTRELAQLGVAVEIIDHQFNVLYSQLANNITSLEGQVKEGAARQYEALKTSFEHLESNYKLLQPLYRVKGRIRKEMVGLELYEYIKSFFGEQLEDRGIQLTITDKAKAYSIFSYESVLKPVLINLVNNAIYWLRNSERKEIRIDVIGNEFIIMNSGENIPEHLLGRIFELFYSKRPNGRGIGLFLAQQSLNNIDLSIRATNDISYNQIGGACFIIDFSQEYGIQGNS